MITSFVKWKNERKFLFLWLIISVVFCFGKRYLTKPDDGYQWVKTNCSNCGKNVFCEVTYYTDYYPWREGLFIDGPFYICSDKCDELYREKRKEKNILGKVSIELQKVENIVRGKLCIVKIVGL